MSKKRQEVMVDEVMMSEETAKKRSSDASEVVAMLRRGGEALSEEIQVEIDEIKMRPWKNISSIRSEREEVEGTVKPVRFVQFCSVHSSYWFSQKG